MQCAATDVPSYICSYLFHLFPNEAGKGQTMKNPNGYGSVVKLSGNRRRPFVVRKTKGFNDKGYPIYDVIGYFATRKEGLMALAEYNKNPYNVDAVKITVKDLYQKWLEVKLPKLGKSNQACLRTVFRYFNPILDMKYKDLRAFNMQEIIDGCGKGYSTQAAIKSLFRHLDRFALELDVINKAYSDLLTSDSIPESTKTPFSEDEIQMLWKVQDKPFVDSVLVLIYSGWRISELLNLKWSDIDLEEMLMKGGSKTASGKNRIVPVHPLIQPLIEHRYSRPERSEYLFDLDGKKLTLGKYYEYWNQIMKGLNMKHTPHECRHTFRSRLDSVGANKVCIDLLMGHKSKEVGERVYTHKTVSELREALALVTR